jgi:DNA-binding response OmpR family regulator
VLLSRYSADNNEVHVAGRFQSVPRKKLHVVETPKKIPCIEDDRETAALIAENLCDHGFDVVVVRDGHAGLSAILQCSPDLVLRDVYIPVISGFDMMERLVATAPDCTNTPFVFPTAMTDNGNTIKPRKFGHHILKSIDFDKLGSIIDARMRVMVSETRTTSVNQCDPEIESSSM